MPSSRSLTSIRSSAEWTSRDASVELFVRSGKNPYAIVPNVSRRKWLSVNPGRMTGRTAAPGSSRATQSAIASKSGVAADEREPPTRSIHSSS